MSDPRYLEFNHELVDAGTPTLVQYGSVWAVWLLGVAKQLTNPEIWSPDSDRVEAVHYANELVARLMGMSDLSAQVMAVMSESITGLQANPLPGKSATWFAPAQIGFFQAGVVSPNADTIYEWVYVDVFLPVGDYTMTFNFLVGAAYGKYKVLCSTVEGLSGDVVDCYVLPASHLNVRQETISVVVAGVHRFTIEHHPKNFLSSNEKITFMGVVIRRDA